MSHTVSDFLHQCFCRVAKLEHDKICSKLHVRYISCICVYVCEHVCL